MVVSTKSLVRLVPAPPAPPACVLAAASASALTFDDDLEIDRAHAARQAELVAKALSPLLDVALGRFNIHAVADGLALWLEQQRGLSGCELTCEVKLRPKHEANGWF